MSKTKKRIKKLEQKIEALELKIASLDSTTENAELKPIQNTPQEKRGGIKFSM
ncbi:hypothetical protein [Alkalihalobacterium alkalinitrilicum]|uniref:hypothetical protein n=1 Tax=Alkalihalobacterium alkalinitrilicum TaxID=427920 RepID=UPI00130340C7|nr:hypothetical protein [Alkalihalobacterium alkalinitrilicum]